MSENKQDDKTTREKDSKHRSSTVLTVELHLDKLIFIKGVCLLSNLDKIGKTYFMFISDKQIYPTHRHT